VPPEGGKKYTWLFNDVAEGGGFYFLTLTVGSTKQAVQTPIIVDFTAEDGDTEDMLAVGYEYDNADVVTFTVKAAARDGGTLAAAWYKGSDATGTLLVNTTDGTITGTGVTGVKQTSDTPLTSTSGTITAALSMTQVQFETLVDGASSVQITCVITNPTHTDALATPTTATAGKTFTIAIAD